MNGNEFDDSRYIQNDKLNTIFFKNYKLMNNYKNI